MNLRVLLAVHGYPPTARAGAENHAARSARYFADVGGEVRVLTFESWASTPLKAEDTDEQGVLVRRLSGDPTGGADAFRASYESEPMARALREFVADWRPDVLYVFSGYLMSSSIVRAAADMGVPVVVNLTDYWWFCHQINLLVPSGGRCDGPTPAGCTRCLAERRRRWRLPAAAAPGTARAFWHAAGRLPMLDRALGFDEVRRRARVLGETMSRITAFVAPSHFLEEFHRTHGIDEDRIHVVRQGLEIRQRLAHVPSDTMRFTFMGQLKAHKGVMTLLDAWDRLRGPRARTLTLWGSAAGEEAFGERVRQAAAGLRGAEWRGAFPPEQVWQVLASTDVTVIPSLWVENSPNVILESQAMQVPLVGSNIGGIAELIAHERDGLLFDTGDAADLARQLQRLLDEPGLRDRLSASAPPVRSAADEMNEVAALFSQLLPA